MSATRENLISVIEELNEKKNAGIEFTAETPEGDLVDSIMGATDDGKDLKKLSKKVRQTIKELVDAGLAELPPVDNDEQQAEETTQEAAAEENEPATDNEEAAEEQAAEENGEQQPEENAPAAEENPEPQIDLHSREALNKAALDMNEVMGLEPGIDIKLDDEMFMKAFVKGVEMATSTDNFTDFTWQVLAAHNLGPERILQKPIVAKKDKAEKKQGEKKEKKAKTPSEPKVGVCSLITDYLIAHDGQEVTREEIHKFLVEKLPDRDEDSMMNSVRTAIPGKWSKTKGFIFEKTSKGTFKVTAPKE